MVRQAYQSLLEEAVIAAPDQPGVGPVALGGFRFDVAAIKSPRWRAFPDALLVVPRFLWTFSGDRCWLTLNFLLAPGADPGSEGASAVEALKAFANAPPVEPRQSLILERRSSPREEWTQRVQQVLRAIEAGQVRKVVLTRRRSLASQGPFPVEAALRRLSESYQECSVFAVERQGATFLGASPEVLARLSNMTLHVSCLAGTAPRGSGPTEDERLQQQLLASAKERSEHAAVVEVVAQTLAGLCQDLRWNSPPRILRLKTVQHLATSFTGRLNAGCNLLQVVERLHPTPAVAGAPSGEALSIIRRMEEDRGWYAAPIGWLDHRGEGEFNVGIRSALLSGTQATLFAGSGIVAGSDPDVEFVETELKFLPLLQALGGC